MAEEKSAVLVPGNKDASFHQSFSFDFTAAEIVRRFLVMLVSGWLLNMHEFADALCIAML